MKLDEQRALLATGDGVIARLPGIVLVAVPAAGHEPRISELIALCREVGEASPEAPGRALARRMAGLLSGRGSRHRARAVRALPDRGRPVGDPRRQHRSRRFELAVR